MNTSNWREHWFVTDILNELPVAGSFFKEPNIYKAAYDAGKCAAMLFGGITSMHIMPQDHSEDNIKILYTAVLMSVGMFSGKVAYNMIARGGSLLYQYANHARQKCNRELEDEGESQHLSLQHTPI